MKFALGTKVVVDITGEFGTVVGHTEWWQAPANYQICMDGNAKKPFEQVSLHEASIRPPKKFKKTVLR